MKGLILTQFTCPSHNHLQPDPLPHDRSDAALAGRQFRPVRQTRATRLTRLAPVQRLAQLVEDVRRWLGLDQTEAVEQKETVAEAVKPTEPVQPAEKIAPAVKQPPGQRLRREIAQQPPQQRRSGGMHV